MKNSKRFKFGRSVICLGAKPRRFFIENSTPQELQMHAPELCGRMKGKDS